MTYPTFTNGQVLPASDLNAIGLWLVKSQAIGTGVSTVAVTNAFSADYDNYKIVVSGGVGTASPQAVSMQLGSLTANYYQILSYWTYAGVATVVTVNNGAAWSFVGEISSDKQAINIDVLAPFLTKATTFSGGYSGSVAGVVGGYQASSTSQTGFTLTFPSGTTGGTISVYGYRKA